MRLQRMRVLVNHAARANDAGRILANLASVAKSYLALALEPAGCIREDVQLAQARWLNMSVVEAFPGSPAALDVDRLAADVLRWPAPENASGPRCPSRLPPAVRPPDVPGRRRLNSPTV
jgi:flagellar biosynthesis protein FlhG